MQPQVMSISDIIDFFKKLEEDAPAAEYAVTTLTEGLVIANVPARPTIH